MRRPSFQFYPADWRNNANLRRCSPAARGIWMDVMCVLHDSDEYGVVHWPLADLANSANAPMRHIKELVEKSVLKGAEKRLEAPFIYTPRSGRKVGEPVTLVEAQDGPVWFSSRMVRDEYVRTIRGESSRFGEGNGAAPNKTPKAAPKPPFGDGSSSSSSSTPTGYSVPYGTGGAAAGPAGHAPAEAMTGSQLAESYIAVGARLAPDVMEPRKQEDKAALWRAAKSVLFIDAGTPLAKGGELVGKLARDYGETVLMNVLVALCTERPAGPAAWLKAACQLRAGEMGRSNKQARLEAANDKVGAGFLSGDTETPGVMSPLEAANDSVGADFLNGATQ